MWQYLSRPYWATSLARKSKGKNQKAKRQGRDKDREKRGEELEELEGNVASSAPCTNDEHWVRSGESATSSGTYMCSETALLTRDNSQLRKLGAAPDLGSA